MRGHVRLHEQAALVGLDAAGEQRRGSLQSQGLGLFCAGDGALAQSDLVSRVDLNFFAEVFSHMAGGERVVIDHGVEAPEFRLVVVLEVNPVLHGTEIITQVDKAGGLYARHDYLFDQLFFHV